MSKRLKIALGVSVALNLFAVAAGTAYAITHSRAAKTLEAQHGIGRHMTVREMLADFDPETRDRVRQALRESALAAHGDFEAARAGRRQALEAARQPTMDVAHIEGLLSASREAEFRGRARLEDNAVAVLSTLTLEQRTALSPILQRKSDRRSSTANGQGQSPAHGQSKEAPPAPATH